MFFSEEKNQKTFISPPASPSRPWPDTGEAAQKVKVFWFFSSEKNILLAALLLILACPFAAATGLSSTETAAIDRAVTDTLQAAGVPAASIAVVKNGQLAYAQAYGFAELPARRATQSMAFAIGSVSKQFTASLILLLAQDGKLSLDDKVGRFMPDLAGAQQVSIRQILSHTAGYEDFAPEDYTTPPMTKPTTPEAMVAEWGRKKLDFKPGTAWQYSNTGYTIAALIAQKAGGAPFFDQLRARILAPLRLRSAVDYDAHGIPAGGPAGYQRHALGPPRLAARDQPGWSFGSGGLAMTAADLATWDISLMNRSLLAPASYDALETPVKLADGTDTGYGLGVQLRQAGRHHGIVHTGEETGFTAYNEVFPADHAAVAVLVNEDATPASAVIARQIEGIAFGIPPAASADPARARLAALLGQLAEGHIDKPALNANAQFYFSPAVLADYQKSLSALGPLIGMHERMHQARGGMIYHVYDVQYLTRRVVVTTYELPDGRLGQLLVEP
jgi:CubicO group peptidase (beta-lactamase class C family)